MNKIVSFLMVGLFFALFNVATVAAEAPTDCMAEPTEALKNACFEHQSTGHNPGDGEDCAGMPTPEETAACFDRQPAGAHGGAAPTTADGDAGTGAGDGEVALTIDDPRCIVAPEARDHRCPGFVAP